MSCDRDIMMRDVLDMVTISFLNPLSRKLCANQYHRYANSGVSIVAYIVKIMKFFAIVVWSENRRLHNGMS